MNVKQSLILPFCQDVKTSFVAIKRAGEGNAKVSTIIFLMAAMSTGSAPRPLPPDYRLNADSLGRREDRGSAK